MFCVSSVTLGNNTLFVPKKYTENNVAIWYYTENYFMGFSDYASWLHACVISL